MSQDKRWGNREIQTVLLMVLFLLLALACDAQALGVIKLNMRVTTILNDTTLVEDTPVVFGQYKNDICFDAGYKVCFTNIHRAYEQYDGEFYVIGESDIGEMYSIRIRTESHIILVWIVNLEKGFPHWFMTNYYEWRGN